MDIIHEDTIDIWIAQNHASEALLWSWRNVTKEANWTSPNDIKQSFPKASIITVKLGTIPPDTTRVIFNIGSARLVTHVKFKSNLEGWAGCVFLRWFGSHAAYDKIDWTISEETNI